MFEELYLSCAQLACFDGENDDQDNTDTSDTNDDTQTNDTDKSFTQDDVNKFLADDRRKHKAQLEKLEKTLKDTLAKANLTADERAKLETEMEDLRKQSRTKEQQLAHEKKQVEEKLQAQLKETKANAERYENLYRESTITRALTDAAVANDAFDPSQIVHLMRPYVKMVEVKNPVTGEPTGELTPIVDLPVTNPTTGELEEARHNPDSAVKLWKEQPERYGNLFKSNIVSGVGSNSSAGGIPVGATGKADLRKLAKDPAKFREALKNNPEALGLRRGLR